MPSKQMPRDLVRRMLMTSVMALFVGAPPVAGGEAEPKASAAAVASLEKFLREGGSLASLGEQSFADVPLTRRDAGQAEPLLWNARAKQIREERQEEMKARRLRDGELEMPFSYEVFGEKPEGGRRLFLSLHGGGGTTKQVNDRQWENQKRLYRPEEGVYLAPRAPTDTWNLWHQGHIDPLFQRLIENLIVFEEVDPNRVYLMGYSAGGDGVYQLAPP
jgi:predicted peptidase